MAPTGFASKIFVPTGLLALGARPSAGSPAEEAEVPHTLGAGRSRKPRLHGLAAHSHKSRTPMCL